LCHFFPRSASRKSGTTGTVRHFSSTDAPSAPCEMCFPGFSPPNGRYICVPGSQATLQCLFLPPFFYIPHIIQLTPHTLSADFILGAGAIHVSGQGEAGHSSVSFFFLSLMSYTHTQKSRAQSEKHCRRRGATFFFFNLA